MKKIIFMAICFFGSQSFVFASETTQKSLSNKEMLLIKVNASIAGIQQSSWYLFTKNNLKKYMTYTKDNFFSKNNILLQDRFFALSAALALLVYTQWFNKKSIKKIKQVVEKDDHEKSDKRS